MMKKMLAAAAGLALAAIGSSAADAKMKVFTCFPEWEALVKQIGGDKVETFVAVDPLTNPDHVDVTPALIAALKSADMLVCTGGDFEGEWLPGALQRAGNAKLGEGKPAHFLAMDFVKPAEDHHTKEEEKKEGHLHEHGNPHVQGDPYRIRTLAGQLTKRMAELDKTDAKTYADRGKKFIADLGSLTKELEKKAAKLRGVNILAQHEHSVYLLDWLKIETAGIVEPEVGVPPGPADLAKLVALVPQANAKFIVYAAYEDPRPSQYVAERTKVPLVKLPFTIGGTSDAKTYLDFYRASVDRLLDGLDGRGRD